MRDHSGFVIVRGVVVLAVCSLIGGLVFSGCPTVGPQGPPGPPGPTGPPAPVDRGGIAPGLNVVINSVVVPADGRPVVNFSATDDLDTPLLKAELTDTRFILGFLTTPAGTAVERFESYTTRIENPDGVPSNGDEEIQADYDSARLNGVTEIADGTFNYKFAKVLPGGFDTSATHQVAGQFRRVFAVNGVTYRSNAAEAFRPDGAAITDTREWVETESCNQCHTRLSEHGDIRREMQLCIMCHNHQTVDANTDNSVDMATLIHKIHRGADLPSVLDGEPYQIIGFNPEPLDYSTVVYPQDIRNCNTCHASPAKTSHHLNNPSLAGCASCHDRTWFGPAAATPTGFVNHIVPNVSNESCSTCHMPGGIPGLPKTDIAFAHMTEEEVFGPGLSFEITAINLLPVAMTTDLNVAIDFNIEDGSGAPIDMLSGATMNILAATLAWPVPEYETSVRENVFNSFGQPADGTLMNNGGGAYTYTFAQVVPMGSPETYAVALEGRRPYMDDDGNTLQQGTASNAQMLFTVDSSDPVMRREVVSEESCNVCHNELRFHGELRAGLSYCLMCHNPNATDEGVRPMGALPPETINFKDLIHHIHMGEELTGDFTVYGFGNVAHDFTEVRFPGARQDCALCHVNGSTDLPLPAEALSTMIVQESGGPTLISDVLPERASCTSCHDDGLAELHAILNTDLVASAESCAVCHGPDADFAVNSVHQLAP